MIIVMCNEYLLNNKNTTIKVIDKILEKYKI